MKSLRPARLAGLAGARTLDLRAATPSSGTLSPTSGAVVWNGFSAAAAAAINGEDDCVEGSNCDTFVLKLAPADYTGKTVKIKGNNAPPPVATRAPQVCDFRHDARAVSPPPIMPNLAWPSGCPTRRAAEARSR